MLEDPGASKGDIQEEEDVVPPKVLLKEEGLHLGGFEPYLLWVAEDLRDFSQYSQLLCTQFRTFLHQRIVEVDLL